MPPVIGSKSLTTPSAAKRQGERLDFPVTGMHCAACVGAIERSVGNLDGVSRASVNFATERVSVEYDPKRVDLARIEAAVSSAGPYRLIVSGPESKDPAFRFHSVREDQQRTSEARRLARDFFDILHCFRAGVIEGEGIFGDRRVSEDSRD